MSIPYGCRQQGNKWDEAYKCFRNRRHGQGWLGECTTSVAAQICAQKNQLGFMHSGCSLEILPKCVTRSPKFSLYYRTHKLCSPSCSVRFTSFSMCYRAEERNRNPGQRRKMGASFITLHQRFQNSLVAYSCEMFKHHGIAGIRCFKGYSDSNDHKKPLMLQLAERSPCNPLTGNYWSDQNKVFLRIQILLTWHHL